MSDATYTATRSVDIAINGRTFILTAAYDGRHHYEWNCMCAEVEPGGALSLWDDPISTSDVSELDTLKWGAHLLMSYVLSEDGDIR